MNRRTAIKLEYRSTKSENNHRIPEKTNDLNAIDRTDLPGTASSFLRLVLRNCFGFRASIFELQPPMRLETPMPKTASTCRRVASASAAFRSRAR